MTAQSDALPGVSYVMPVLNEEAHLATSVAEVLAQDYPGELEVVLAIGPSKDRTQEIADKLAEKDHRITIVPNPTGKTPAALNVGIAHAKHDLEAPLMILAAGIAQRARKWKRFFDNRIAGHKKER